MKHNSPIFCGRRVTMLALAALLYGLALPAYCEPEETALLLRQTPAQGGKITPNVGIHHFESGSDVTLTAVANPGYQFLYWAGDVSEPTARSTIAYLDTPKIIIAVFERAEYEFFFPVEQRSQSRPGRGGLYPHARDYGRQGGGGGGGRRPRKFSFPPWEPPEPEELKDFPTPEENNFPVPEPVPEPTTALLVVLGSLLALTKRPAKR